MMSSGHRYSPLIGERVQGDLFSSVLLPLSLALIMFSLGLGLTPADFGRIVRQPRALLVGGVIDGGFREKEE